jgi:glutamate racemase
VIGVINPGVRAAMRATRSGSVGVIGTEATIATGAYQRAVGSAAELHMAACPVFVEHVERADTTSDTLREAARGYLAPLRAREIDTLILGCTHYPLLSGLLQLELGPDVVLVSSAEETAKDVYATLARSGSLREDPTPPHRTFLTTGEPERFDALARVFLGGHELAHVEAEHIDVGGHV